MIGYIAVVVVAAVAIFVAGSLYGKSVEQKAIAALVNMEQSDSFMLTMAFAKIKSRVAKYL